MEGRNNNFFIKNKGAIITIFLVFIITSTTTLIPIVKSELASREIKKNECINGELLKLKKKIEEKLSDEEFQQILMLLENNEIECEVFLEFLNFFGFLDDSQESSNIHMIGETFNLIKEFKRYNQKNLNIDNFSDEFIELHNILEKSKKKSKINANQVINDGDYTWNDYLNNYVRATTVWSGEYTFDTPGLEWFFLKLFKFIHSENNYYDWSTKLISKIEFIFYLSVLVGIFTIPTLMVVPFEGQSVYVNIIAFFALFSTFWFNYNLASYTNNGHEYMMGMKNMEVNILMQIGYEDEDGFIPLEGLDDNQGIEAWNTDAYQWILDTGSEENFGRTNNYFTYYLGADDCIQENDDGWYSLKARYKAEGNTEPFQNYKKAPCPPGNWSIIIHPTNGFKEEKIDVYLTGGQTIILENITLKPDV